MRAGRWQDEGRMGAEWRQESVLWVPYAPTADCAADHFSVTHVSVVTFRPPIAELSSLILTAPCSFLILLYVYICLHNRAIRVPMARNAKDADYWGSGASREARFGRLLPLAAGSDCQNDRSLLAPTAGLIPCSPDAAFARRDPKRNALPNLSSSAEREGASGSSATCRSRSARSSTRAARSNTLATRRKLVAGRFTWQTTSTTPAVIESPWGSTIASTGVTLRGYGPYYQGARSESARSP